MINRYAHNANARRTVTAPDDTKSRMEELAGKLERNRANMTRELETASGADADALRARLERNAAFATGVAEELAKLDGTPPGTGQQPLAPDTARAVDNYTARRYGHNAQPGGGK